MKLFVPMTAIKAHVWSLGPTSVPMDHGLEVLVNLMATDAVFNSVDVKIWPAACEYPISIPGLHDFVACIARVLFACALP